MCRMKRNYPVPLRQLSGDDNWIFKSLSLLSLCSGFCFLPPWWSFQRTKSGQNEGGCAKNSKLLFVTSRFMLFPGSLAEDKYKEIHGSFEVVRFFFPSLVTLRHSFENGSKQTPSRFSFCHVSASKTVFSPNAQGKLSSSPGNQRAGDQGFSAYNILANNS